MNGIRPKKAMSEMETEEDWMALDQQLQRERDNTLRHVDYMRVAKQKLEQLKKGVKLRHTFDDDDDFDDLDDDDDDDFGEDDDDDEDS